MWKPAALVFVFTLLFVACKGAPPAEEAGDKNAQKASNLALPEGVPQRAHVVLAQGSGMLRIGDAKELLAFLDTKILDLRASLDARLGKDKQWLEAILATGNSRAPIYISLPAPQVQIFGDAAEPRLNFSLLSVLSIPSAAPLESQQSIDSVLVEAGATKQNPQSCKERACQQYQLEMASMPVEILMVPRQGDLLMLFQIWPDYRPREAVGIDTQLARVELAPMPSSTPSIEALFTSEAKAGLWLDYVALANLSAALSLVQVLRAMEELESMIEKFSLSIGMSDSLEVLRLANEGLDYRESAFVWRGDESLTLVHSLSPSGREIQDALALEEAYLPSLSEGEEPIADLSWRGNRGEGLGQAPLRSAWSAKAEQALLEELFLSSRRGPAFGLLALAQLWPLQALVDVVLKDNGTKALPDLYAARFILLQDATFGLALVFENEAERDAFAERYIGEYPWPSQVLEEAAAPTFVLGMARSRFSVEPEKEATPFVADVDLGAVFQVIQVVGPIERFKLRRRQIGPALVDDMIFDASPWPQVELLFNQDYVAPSQDEDSPIGCAARRTEMLLDFFDEILALSLEERMVLLDQVLAHKGDYKALDDLDDCAAKDPQLSQRITLERALFLMLRMSLKHDMESTDFDIYGDE